jgi:methylmalonyl-CoA mutase
LSKYVADAIQVIKAANRYYHPETSGIGQSDTEIMDHSDVSSL